MTKKLCLITALSLGLLSTVSCTKVQARMEIREGNTDSYQLQQTVRRTIGRWVSNTHRRRPMIIPVVIEA